jgi:hypothetical protein
VDVIRHHHEGIEHDAGPDRRRRVPRIPRDLPHVREHDAIIADLPEKGTPVVRDQRDEVAAVGSIVEPSEPYRTAVPWMCNDSDHAPSQAWSMTGT